MQKETAIRNWGWRGPEENKSDKKCFLEFTEVHLHFSFLGLFCWVMLGAAIIVSAYHNSQRVPILYKRHKIVFREFGSLKIVKKKKKEYI